METLYKIYTFAAQVGGIISLIGISAGMIFREYIKARFQDRFIQQQIDKKYTKDHTLVLQQRKSDLEAKLLEKLFDLRMSHLERLSKQSWTVSDCLCSYLTECLITQPVILADASYYSSDSFAPDTLRGNMESVMKQEEAR